MNTRVKVPINSASSSRNLMAASGFGMTMIVVREWPIRKGQPVGGGDIRSRHSGVGRRLATGVNMGP
jgi:hypothetical protein